MPCTPEEAARLAKLSLDGKVGETTAEPIFALDQPMTMQSDTPADVMTKQKLGWLGFARTVRAAFGDKLSVQAIDKVIDVDTRANNFLSKEYKALKEAIAPLRRKYAIFDFGLSEQNSMDIASALEHIGPNGKFQGPPASFSPEVIKVAENVHKWYDKLFQDWGIDPALYRNGYRPLIRQRPSGIFFEPMDTPLENSFRSKITPDQVKFYHELERKGTIMDPDPTLEAGAMSYLRGIANAKIRRPVIEQLEENVINPAFGVQFVKRMNGTVDVMADDAVGHGLWKEYIHHVFGGPTPTDKMLTNTLQQMGGMFGKTADTRSLYKISHGLSGAFFAGALGSPLGGRPASIIRQFFQLVPSYAELGPKAVMEGMQRTFQKGSKDFMERGIITSPIDGLVDNMTIASMRGAGKAFSDMSEASMKVFSWADMIVRTITAHGAEAKFEAYAADNMLGKLGGRREFKDEMMRLVKQDPTLEQAKDAYVREVVKNTQYAFGKANRPMMFRGALQNLAATFMSYPMNTFEMARMFGKRAGQAVQEEGLKGLASDDARPLVRLILTTSAMLYAGSEYLNADLRSAFITGAIPHSLAFPKMGLDAFQAANSNVEWLTGNLFNIGETDYRKQQRLEYDRNFGRDLRPFVPGGIFFTEDVPKAIDKGSILRMLALTPKAAELNQEARQRAAAARQSSGGGGFGQLRGFGGGFGGSQP